MGFYSVGLGVGGATRWAQPTWARLEGGHPGGLCSPGGALRWFFTPVFFIYSEIILQKVSFESENFYFCKKNTMVVLLKTASTRVSSIQIMQISVQNRGKSVWKSRYDGEVSTPPSLNLCLSSSNSVDRLKVIKKNFYKLCLLLLL